MRLSYSSLDTYKNCGLKYKYKEIDKIDEPKSKEAVFGTVVHGALKFAHTPSLIPPTLDQTLDYFARSWNPAVFDDPSEERAAFSQGVSMLQRYYQDNNIAAANIVALESRFQFDVGPEDNRHTLSGIIDRIDKTDDGYEIIDYKTAKKLPAQADVDANAQLTIYLRAFLERYPAEWARMESITVSLYFLKHGVKLSSKRTRADLEQMEQDVLATVAAIDAKRFDAHVSPLCDWCGFQRVCPMQKHKFKDAYHAPDDTEAEAAIDALIALKKRMSTDRVEAGKLQATVMDYMEKKAIDRAFGTTGVVAKTQRVTYDYDVSALRRTLAAIDQWDDVVKVDGSALSRILPSLPPDIQDAVAAARTERTTTTLSIKKTPSV